MTLSNSYSHQIYLRIHPDPKKNLDERLITKEDFDEEYKVDKGGRDD